MSTTQPTLFLSHGAPPLADDPRWPDQLHALAQQVGAPTNILIVSAHWEDAPAVISSTTPGTPLVYDFWGFPQHYYEVTYEAPVAPELGRQVAAALGGTVLQDPARGLDHGAYVPLKAMYPDADVPVLQLSLPTLNPAELLEFGRALAPLRDEGTLIVGSGFATHNLGWMTERDAPAPTPGQEFDAWAAETVAGGDLDALVDFMNRAPAARQAHPRTEHWAPLYIAMGAAGADRGTSVIDGTWHGLSKRSWLFSDAA